MYTKKTEKLRKNYNVYMSVYRRPLNSRPELAYGWLVVGQSVVAGSAYGK